MNKNTSLFGRWKKVLIGSVIGLLSLGAVALGASSAQAQMMTVAELQAQVELLIAQLARMQSGASTSCYEFGRDLTVGSTGLDVSALQDYLTTTDHFSFAVGSTGYFGEITRNAVAAWQSSNGVAPAAGYFGPLSRARYALLCQPIDVTPPADDDEDDDSDNDETDQDDAEEAIQDARAAIGDAEDEIEEADDDGDDVEEARDLLESANDRLDDAEDAFDDDEFEDAIELAGEAMELADDAVDAIDDESESTFESGTARSPVGNNKARADFEIEFTLAAFGETLYIPRDVARDDDPSDGSSGIEYFIEDSSGDAYEDGDASASFVVEDAESGDTSDYYVIEDDESRTFTLQVSLDNDGGTAGFYGLQLSAIRFDSNTSSGGEVTNANGLDDYDTNKVFVDDEN